MLANGHLNNPHSQYKYYELPDSRLGRKSGDNKVKAKPSKNKGLFNGSPRF